MKKQLICLLTAVAMLLSMLSAVFAEGTEMSGQCGDNLTWTLDDKGTLIISGSGDMWPAELALSGRKRVKAIVIEPGVTSISDNAFAFCEFAESVVIPDTVTYIGNNSFRDCEHLKSVKIPSSVSAINDETFFYCFALENVEIPDSVTYIGDSVFEGCTELKSITIPNSVVYIGEYAFDSCENLENVVLSEKLKFIGNYIFYGCKKLESIELPNSLETIGYMTFADSGIKNIVIPDNVTHIGVGAFAYTNLESISIPISVTSIDNSAFFDCGSLSRINYSGSKEDWDKIKKGKESEVLVSEKVTYGNQTVNNDENYIDADISMLEFDALTGTVTGISKKNAGGTLEIPAEINGTPVTAIGDRAFSGCCDLKGVKLPDSVKRIGSHAFENCYNITEINIPEGISAVEDYTFYYCKRLQGIKLPKSIKRIGDKAFRCCESFTEIELPPNLESIGNYAFGGCYQVENITIPDKVTLIDSYAFYDCESLKNQIIPDSVTKIGNYVFAQCHSLESLTIPANADIGFSVCDNCFLLESVTLPEGLKSLNDIMFQRCEKLESVTIPASVEYIGFNAFYNCENLKNVYYAGSEEDWNKIKINENNEILQKASLHFNSSAQETAVSTVELATREYAINAFADAAGYGWEKKQGDLTAFKDYSLISEKYADNIAYAVGNNVVTGYEDNTLRPKDTIQRVEALVILARCIRTSAPSGIEATLTGEPIEFTDVPEWARDDIDYLSIQNIVKGYGDGRLGSDDPLTTEQVRLLTERIIEPENL